MEPGWSAGGKGKEKEIGYLPDMDVADYRGAAPGIQEL
jgi:hypothetical protein